MLLESAMNWLLNARAGRTSGFYCFSLQQPIFCDESTPEECVSDASLKTKLNKTIICLALKKIGRIAIERCIKAAWFERKGKTKTIGTCTGKCSCIHCEASGFLFFGWLCAYILRNSSVLGRAINFLKCYFFQIENYEPWIPRYWVLHLWGIQSARSAKNYWCSLRPSRFVLIYLLSCYSRKLSKTLYHMKCPCMVYVWCNISTFVKC